MDKVRDGDIRQLAPLFERHHLKLYNFYLRLTGNRHVSEDMVQEVFFRMLKYRHTFRGDGEFIARMYHLARNVHKDHYSKWRIEPAMAEEQLEQKQDRELLQQALARLPMDKKELLILSRYQNLRYDVIAELLGCSAYSLGIAWTEAAGTPGKWHSSTRRCGG